MTPKDLFVYGERFLALIDSITKLAVALPAYIREAQAAGEDSGILQNAHRVRKSREGNPGSGSQALAILKPCPTTFALRMRWQAACLQSVVADPDCLRSKRPRFAESDRANRPGILWVR